jgi:hypothetical protein
MYSHKSKIICSEDPSPLAPAPPRPQPGCGPAPSSSDAHSVTLDILHWSLLDLSYPLTSCTSDWAVMGGDLEVLNWLRRPLLPAGPHVQGGATARHTPPSRAWRHPPPLRTNCLRVHER